MRNVVLVTLVSALLTACGVSDSVRIAAPAVVAVFPEPGVSGVAVDTALWAEFDGSVDASWLAGSFSLTDADGTTIVVSMAYDDLTHTATFTTSQPLSFGTAYVAAIEAGVSTLSATAVLAEDAMWTFTTVMAPESPDPGSDDAGSDQGSDTTTEPVTDSDDDSGTDPGTDTGHDSDGDSNTDTGDDADSDTDVGDDADSDTDVGDDTDTNNDDDSGNDSGTDSGSDAGNDADTDTDSDTDAGNDSDTDTDTDTDTDAGPGYDPGTGDTGSEDPIDSCDEYGNCTKSNLIVDLTKVVIPENATWTLENVTIIGTLSVSRGATLYGTNILILGSFEADRAEHVELTDSRVTVNLSIQRGGSATLRFTAVEGNAEFIANDGDVQLEGNHFYINVAVDANKIVVIDDNAIGGNLGCSRNAPAPSGTGNTAADFLGQCTGLD